MNAGLRKAIRIIAAAALIISLCVLIMYVYDDYRSMKNDERVSGLKGQN